VEGLKSSAGRGGQKTGAVWPERDLGFLARSFVAGYAPGGFGDIPPFTGGINQRGTITGGDLSSGALGPKLKNHFIHFRGTFSGEILSSSAKIVFGKRLGGHCFGAKPTGGGVKKKINAFGLWIVSNAIGFVSVTFFHHS